MTSATIKLFLLHGDAKRLRVGEVSNWTGKALAAPRTELDDLLQREETENSGIYFLFGSDPESGDPLAYIGEAEVIRDRLENSNTSNPKLPESDREDMEVFLSRIQQVLPVLGADLLAPVSGASRSAKLQQALICKNRGAEARGRRTESGFVVLKGSTAVVAERPSAESQHPYVVALRKKLVQGGALVENDGFLEFSKDVEFDSPSAAAAVVHGGGANGLTAWKDAEGRTLKEIKEN